MFRPPYGLTRLLGCWLLLLLLLPAEASFGILHRLVASPSWALAVVVSWKDVLERWSHNGEAGVAPGI